jgi:hypothetical protein
MHKSATFSSGKFPCRLLSIHSRNSTKKWRDSERQHVARLEFIFPQFPISGEQKILPRKSATDSNNKKGTILDAARPRLLHARRRRVKVHRWEWNDLLSVLRRESWQIKPATVPYTTNTWMILTSQNDLWMLLETNCASWSKHSKGQIVHLYQLWGSVKLPSDVKNCPRNDRNDRNHGYLFLFLIVPLPNHLQYSLRNAVKLWTFLNHFLTLSRSPNFYGFLPRNLESDREQVPQPHTRNICPVN